MTVYSPGKETTLQWLHIMSKVYNLMEKAKLQLQEMISDCEETGVETEEIKWWNTVDLEGSETFYCKLPMVDLGR